eukprot:XP_014008895.1 PREDICTED: zyxin-like [Salmo salar]
METRGPFNPKLPSQYSAPPPPAPKPAGPPPTAPKPNLSFLPPPEMGDKPPPAPWLCWMTARTLIHTSTTMVDVPSKLMCWMTARTLIHTSTTMVDVPSKLMCWMTARTLIHTSTTMVDVPIITSAPTEVCGKCGEALSRSQPAVRAMNKLFHSDCFCCMSCHRPLQGMQFYDKDGTPQCEDCYTSSLAVCSRCGERITDRVLKAVGQCFHAHCFRCCTCACSLEGAPFITDDDNNPYCVPDYHRYGLSSPCLSLCLSQVLSCVCVRTTDLLHLKYYRCEVRTTDLLHLKYYRCEVRTTDLLHLKYYRCEVRTTDLLHLKYYRCEVRTTDLLHLKYYRCEVRTTDLLHLKYYRCEVRTTDLLHLKYYRCEVRTTDLLHLKYYRCEVRTTDLLHLKCYRCEDCSRPLSIEADADGCYPLDGRILCMKCHTQRAKAMQ